MRINLERRIKTHTHTHTKTNKNRFSKIYKKKYPMRQATKGVQEKGDLLMKLVEEGRRLQSSLKTFYHLTVT